MKIEILTDCTGIKQDAIRNVFSKRFEAHEIKVTLAKSETFQTPLTQDDFVLTVKKRFQSIKKSPHALDVYVATIQKGYYYSDGLWFFTACVGIAYPLFNILPVMASSVPVPPECSEKKSSDLSKNMSDILKEANPKWNIEKSVYTLLTGENERVWLEQPLRHCLKTIL